MSGAVVKEDNAIVFVWLAICSFYTSLLTITALVVVYIFRKRRSSILKSQRPPRTPFSDLEFNVATPTDTNKSRRVSFSKRTGVAEFATNEATTTWKNFYEEHNKSLESSGNDFGVNVSKQPIGHIGKRIFDQQFEIEAIDISILKPGEPMINTSMNNVNFTHQIALLECTGDDRKLTAPQSNFELSTFTDHRSIVLGSDLAIHSMGEITDRIDVNFSDVQNIGCNDDNDDLDEIQKDLENARNNSGYHRSTKNARDISEYIELNFDTTNIGMKFEESDMSITDTVHSPKVQDVSQNFSLDKKSNSANKDWVNDKENIAINPYVAPQESANFAINEEPDKVLVFDGKRLTIQSEKRLSQKHTADTSPKKIPQRKTIVLNMNDDLPNYVDMQTSRIETTSGTSLVKPRQSVTFNDGDLSMTQPLIGRIEQNTSIMRTMVHDNDIADISVTQAIPHTIILPEKTKGTDKRRTIVYENDMGNISVTQALPNIILLGNSEKISEQQKTIVLENETVNISITQAVPSNIIAERRKTILYENDDGNVSLTQAMPSYIIAPDKANNSEKRRTIVYENDTGNISITQAIPTNILLAKNTDKFENDLGVATTIVFDDDDNDLCDKSLTKAVPQNIIPYKIETERRTTIAYETENDISTTQAVPTNFTIRNISNPNITIFDKDDGNISVTQAIPTNILLPEPHRRRTVVFDDDTANLSITQAVPTNQVIPGFTDTMTCKESAEICNDNDMNDMQNIENTNKRKTIMFENDDADVSMTQAIPVNIIHDVAKTNDKSRIFFDEDNTADISITQNVPANVLLLDGTTENKADISEVVSQEPKRQTIVFQDEDVSMTEIISKTVRTANTHKRKSVTFSEISINEALTYNEVPEKRKTVEFDNDKSNLSMAKRVSDTITSLQSEDFDNYHVNKNVLETSKINLDFIIYQTDTTHNRQKLQSNIINPSNSKTQNSINEDTKHSPQDVGKAIETSESEESVKTGTSGQTQILIRDADIPQDNLNVVSVDPKISCFDNCELESSSSKADEVISKNRNTILNELLDMSTGSLHGGFNEKNILDPTVENVVIAPDNTSRKGYNFFIRQDSDDGGQTDESENDGSETISPGLNPDCKKKEKSGIVAEIKNKLCQLKTSIRGKHNLTANRNNEKILSSNLKDKPKNIQNANDTNELLDMLSELTDKSGNNEDQEINPIVPITVKDHKALENDKNADLTSEKEHHNVSNINENRANLSSEKVNNNLAYENEQRINPLTINGLLALENETRAHSVPVKGSTVIDSECAVIEPRKLSFAPSRQSIAFSREDLMNNISMAQAALQLSRQDLDESENIEDPTNDTTIEQYVPHKSIRLSNDVVKTLHFEEDEATSEISLKSEMKASPVKKTTFGETSYIQDRKMKAVPIPSYDVSNGIKELMDDLVKPMADVMPFDSVGIDTSAKKVSSTCSTQIQANLVTSSQIEIGSELTSDSAINMKQLESLASGIAVLGNEAVARALKNPVQRISTEMLEKSSESEVPCQADRKDQDTRKKKLSPRVESYKEQKNQQKRSPPHQRSPPNRLIVFDHNNPLNNVLLGSIDYSEVHKYHPGISTESLSSRTRYDSAQISVNEDEKCNEMERISQHYNVESRLSMKQSVQQAGDASSEKAVDAQSILSNDSKPMSVDQSVDAQVVVVDTEVNTMIAMKGNNELLERSSSLTLVDDAFTRTTLDITNSPTIGQQDNHSSKSQTNAVKVIYKTSDQEIVSSEKQDSDFTSNDDLVKSLKKCIKAKKNNSPPKREKQKKLTFDLTPKHMSKIQKRSNSPRKVSLSPQKISCLLTENVKTEVDTCTVDPAAEDMDVSPESTKQINKQKSPKKVKNSPKGKKGTTITVQQLVTEYFVDMNINQKSLNNRILEVLNDPISGCSSVEPKTISDDESKSLVAVSSFTSSKNEIHEDPSLTASSSVSSAGTNQTLKLGWNQALFNDMTSLYSIDECESSVNVVAKINMLPFMGSHDCEWEATSGDTWSFRLLHGRLRLSVRLAHQYDNATRSHVRADTAVLDVTIENVLHVDKKNTVALLCVRFAQDAMRYYIGRGCSRAADVPLLLRRCAAVARVAIRWGRAMQEARMHLAYSLAPTGHLTLKVANIPLRSVWEVSMQMELVVEGGPCAPWPRALALSVERVVAECEVPREQLHRLQASLPHDWGHVPRTLWKVFKYLKHKRRDDASLLGF